MVKPEWMNAGEFDRIKQSAGEAIALVRELRATK
jgi:hypothetical protein